jgi:hypothetical protein
MLGVVSKIQINKITEEMEAVPQELRHITPYQRVEIHFRLNRGTNRLL